MIPLLLPILAASLGGAAFLAAKKHGENIPTMDPQRQMLYQKLLRDPEYKDPVILRQYADEFARAGLKPQAELLRKRAALREMPQPVKEQQRQIYRKAMKSKNPAAILNVADHFETMGATGAAESLRNYANGIPTAAVDDVQEEPTQTMNGEIIQ